MRIALTGNPNSGKTTMFNALTGSNERVGNWAGVTVDRKEAPIKKVFSEGKELIAVDLPGAYSMSPFTTEESITSTYVRNEPQFVLYDPVDGIGNPRGSRAEQDGYQPEKADEDRCAGIGIEVGLPRG